MIKENKKRGSEKLELSKGIPVIPSLFFRREQTTHILAMTEKEA